MPCFCYLDVDECDSSVARCHSNALCKNTAPGYCCECKDGFYGNGIDCAKEGKIVLALYLVVIYSHYASYVVATE